MGILKHMNLLLLVFRCDSISWDLPPSVSGSVSDSFRSEDSYRISKLCKLVQLFENILICVISIAERCS